MQFSAELPTPPATAIAQSQRLIAQIRARITQTGPIRFADFMAECLYAPELGYYMNSLPKFGRGGDFTTAPETSALFAQCLAQQITEVLHTLGQGDILEFGAGSGQLMLDILTVLEAAHTLPNHYYILEISPALQQQQRQLLADKLPHLMQRVCWLETCPESFQGVVIANEVLDAMPVQRFRWQEERLWQLYVDWEKDGFVEKPLPPDSALSQQIEQLEIPFTNGYTSELNTTLTDWFSRLTNSLQRGVILLFDYGLPRHEYYHPQRWMGTLLCHYQHRVHADPFWWPGLQDITAFVDFSAVHTAAAQNELLLCGYTTQANFLLSCGLLDIAAKMPGDFLQQYAISQQLKKLLLPSEMGEAFKVLALAKAMTLPLLGFKLHNMQEKLFFKIP